MSAMAASRLFLLLHLRPGLELCPRARALTAVSSRRRAVGGKIFLAGGS
ncbi:hypothetical protein ACP4OV_026072 [Aristida adscensionis]